MIDGTCVEGEPVYFQPGESADSPGHIYSLAGIREFRISGWCEYHFDEITKEEE